MGNEGCGVPALSALRNEVTDEARDNVGADVDGAMELALEETGWSTEGSGGRFQPNSDVRAAVVEGSSCSNRLSEGESDRGDPSEVDVIDRGLATLKIVNADMSD